MISDRDREQEMSFGSLTLSNNINYTADICTNHLDNLFKNANKRLEKFAVIDLERQIAFENLKKLTTELQTKRLRYNAKSYCKYFTL